MKSTCPIALAQYPLQPFSSIAEWRQNASNWVQEAAKHKARLLVFPEYGSTDLSMAAGMKEGMAANDMIAVMQNCHDVYVESLVALARKNNVYIVAGSFPCSDGGKYFNRSYFFGPGGAHGYQDKLMLTRFERERTFLSPGNQISLFETEFGLLSIAICFDIQFPLIIRKIAEAGCDLFIVPSCTGALKGYNRVKTGCQARALENQMAVVQSPTVGDSRWQPIADTNQGAAGVFTPADNGLPDDGILAIGELNKPGWVYADIDFEACQNLRKNGHVLNWQCWDEQEGPLALPALRARI